MVRARIEAKEGSRVSKAGAARRRFLFCALEHHHHTLPSILDVNVYID
jgi:hypothetical protein